MLGIDDVLDTCRRTEQQQQFKDLAAVHQGGFQLADVEQVQVRSRVCHRVWD